MFLHQHPKYEGANMVFLLGDASGMERVARLFPIRTGVTVPDWLITGEKADNMGTAGLMGAG